MTTYTYTTVHKDYEAPTFGEAMSLLMHDPEIWREWDLTAMGEDVEARASEHYLIDSWSWHPAEHRLRVNFR